MISRTACFACTTPYQLLGAIAIVQNNNIEADLYLLGMFPNYEIVAKRIKEYGIFKEVYSVDCSHFKERSFIKNIWQYINCRKEVERFLPSSISYSCFYSSSRQHVKLLLLHELKRRNSNIKCVIYEDGLGSYTPWSKVLNTPKNRQKLESLLGWNLFRVDNTAIMVTHPELLDLPHKLDGIEIKKMPPFRCMDYKDMLCNVFSVGDDDIINEKVIIFDGPRGFYKNDIGMNLKMMDICYKLAVDKFMFENVICKLHPKSKNMPEVGIKVYRRSSVPVEILYAGMPDLESRILIGIFSTALYTPKMMFDKEPVVISLHNIIWPNRIEINPVFDKLNMMYQHKERIVAPHNLDELKTCLQSFKL